MSFVGTRTKLTQEEESAKNAALRRLAKRPAEKGAGEGEGEGEGHVISENVFLHGLAGAKLRLSTTGEAGLLQHFQKLPPAGIAVANDLLFRFPGAPAYSGCGGVRERL